MRILAGLLFGMAVLSAQPALANPVAHALGECLKDNTSGKERKELARWIFVSMAAHPDMRNLTTTTDATRLEASKGAAQLFTRLLTENCTTQTRAVVEQAGPSGMGDAFKALGEVAMMELMSNQEVARSINSYMQFLDKKKFEAALGK